MHVPPGHRPEHPPDPGGASDRLRLEVELLADAEPTPAPAEPAPGSTPRTVLVALGEPDLAAYVCRCLHAYPGLVVVEPDPGEPVLASVHRRRPALLIAEPATLGARPPLPLLLLVEEPPDDPAIPPAAPVTVLVQPFNARRLLAAVEPLLGPPVAT